jgi:hypothetical protein
MPKNTLDARIKNYEKQLAGGGIGRTKTASVDSKAFHKPGSNKK